MRASLRATRGNWTIGWPNWMRCSAYFIASSNAACASPTPRDAVWMRALSNVAMSCLKPWPRTRGRTPEEGTTNPSKESSYSFIPR